jgi:hypothetical protein
MRADRRPIGLLILVALLVAASLVGWGFGHHSEKPSAPSGQAKERSAPSGQVAGLVERPSDPQFLPAWQFVNFVDGRESAPTFAPEVTVVIDGQTRVLTGSQAQQRSTWQGSPLDLYAVAKEYILREGGQATPATLTMYVDSGHDFVCRGRELPPQFRSTPSLWLGLVPSGPGLPASCTFLNVYVTGGSIDVLVARTSRRLWDTPELNYAVIGHLNRTYKDRFRVACPPSTSLQAGGTVECPVYGEAGLVAVEVRADSNGHLHFINSLHG